MSDAVIRTEDLSLDEVKKMFVETDCDREIIECLKGKQTILLVGSRGTGKTMLMKVAERELSDNFNKNRILPVFVNLSSCCIHHESNILNVMISRTLIALQKSLRDRGIIVKGKLFAPLINVDENPIIKRLEEYIKATSDTENIIQENAAIFEINDESISKDIGLFKDFLSQICEEFEIKQIIILFDEACQVFSPKQQRIFFYYFRALREHYIVCKAAIYPGVFSYGTFQAFHDATVKKVERSIGSEDYINKMREIVRKNFEPYYSDISTQGELLDNIIYYASGNPRFLIKSINEILSENGKFKVSRVNDVIKEFYGTTIWSEHTKLSDMYPGHTDMINWARNFIESTVLPLIHKSNDESCDKKTIYFLISRKAPEVIQHSIKILEYSGIVSLCDEGVKRRTDVYDRYELNLGVVVLSEKQPNISKRGRDIAINLSKSVSFIEFGANSPEYRDYKNLIEISESENSKQDILNIVLKRDINVLDLTNIMKSKLHENGFNTISDVLSGGEDALRSIPYVGMVRSRKISNLVFNAILEYISG